MAEDMLYDLPKDFYLNGFVKDGVFNVEKAREHGYSEAQIHRIQEWLELEPALSADEAFAETPLESEQ